MNYIGERAVVLGAGMAGLLTARVVSDFYRTVTVVERDRLPDGASQRRGVPQGRHIHGLLSSGSNVLERFFPGLLDELVAAGATVSDEGDFSRVSLQFGGHELVRSGKFGDPASFVFYLPSRPFLEAHVRHRVRAIGNVHILDGHDVVELFTEEPQRVAGVRIANRHGGDGAVLHADLVVDAMGRNARTPAFLDSLGYGRPAESRSVVGVTYASLLLRIPPGTVDEKLVSVGPVPDRPTAGGLFAYENNTWMITVCGIAGYEPPADRAGMIAFAAELGSAPMVAALNAGEPLSDVSIHRFPVSAWRRYDKMRRFPSGLLVVGDAICTTNPIYAQGMSVAALQTAVLHDCLSRGGEDLSRRFFRAAAKPVGLAWQLTIGADLSLPQVPGRRSAALRVMNWYVNRILTAAESDIAVAEKFFRVQNLIDSPARLLHPSFMMRVASAKHRHAGSNPRLTRPTTCSSAWSPPVTNAPASSSPATKPSGGW
jgi:2-polyprenyl-6-methoxyphenol hydroxylase-like FAD-dependent oxidoreductase